MFILVVLGPTVMRILNYNKKWFLDQGRLTCGEMKMLLRQFVCRQRSESRNLFTTVGWVWVLHIAFISVLCLNLTTSSCWQQSPRATLKAMALPSGTFPFANEELHSLASKNVVLSSSRLMYRENDLIVLQSKDMLSVTFNLWAPFAIIISDEQLKALQNRRLGGWGWGGGCSLRFQWCSLAKCSILIFMSKPQPFIVTFSAVQQSCSCSCGFTNT